jgi:hypothetical protein
MIDNNKKLKKKNALPTLAVLVFFPSLIFEHQPKTEKKQKPCGWSWKKPIMSCSLFCIVM